MRILYGVQGTGNGHITRARAMAEEFAMRGVAVDYVFSGRAPEDYFDMACFGNYRTFEGLSFVAKDGKVSLLATCRRASILQFTRDVLKLDLSHYDLILSDFEPITAWAAKRAGRTCIGIGHQYAFGAEIPKYTGDSIGAWILNHYAPVSTSLGVHWHHFGYPILPPIIQTHVSAGSKYFTTDDVLVYLPFESSDEVMEWLEACPQYRFRMHCKDIEPGRYGNVEVYPFSRDGFQKNLQECESVLCNAGFELNSEALHLGRRILVKPLHGQVEQLSNAIALEQLGLARASAQLSSGVITRWLQTSKISQVTYPNVAGSIADWLLQGAQQPIEALCEQLWSQVPYASGLDFSYPRPFAIAG